MARRDDVIIKPRMVRRLIINTSTSRRRCQIFTSCLLQDSCKTLRKAPQLDSQPRAAVTSASAVMPSSFITTAHGALRPKRSMPITLPSRPTYPIPEAGDARLDRDALPAGRENALAVLRRLPVEAFRTRHRDDAHAGAQLLRGRTACCSSLPVARRISVSGAVSLTAT